MVRESSIKKMSMVGLLKAKLKCTLNILRQCLLLLLFRIKHCYKFYHSEHYYKFYNSEHYYSFYHLNTDTKSSFCVIFRYELCYPTSFLIM